MNIKTGMVPLKLHASVPHGFANGYVGVPPGHPWHGKDYDSIEADIHGGLTYSKDHLAGEAVKDPDGYWWVGFDTAHLNDSIHTCPESYVKAEIENLKRQAEAAALTTLPAITPALTKNEHEN